MDIFKNRVYRKLKRKFKKTSVLNDKISIKFCLIPCLKHFAKYKTFKSLNCIINKSGLFVVSFNANLMSTIELTLIVATPLFIYFIFKSFSILNALYKNREISYRDKLKYSFLALFIPFLGIILSEQLKHKKW